MLKQFQKYDPKIKGMMGKEESIRDQLDVIDKLDEKLTGSFVSHHGDLNWF
jgi:hypothetical protein